MTVGMAVTSPGTAGNSIAADTPTATDLTFLASDFFDDVEKCYVVYKATVNGLLRNTARVEFSGSSFSIFFRSRNATFLSLNSPATENTTFRYYVKTTHMFHAKDSSYKVSEDGGKVEIRLKKLDPARWTSVESIGAPTMTPIPVPPPPPPVPLPAIVTSSSGEPDVRMGRVMMNNPSVTYGPRNRDTEQPISPRKPTCIVSPLVPVPRSNLGMTGLDNLGNTCFMNSVVQVLVNTADFKEYFLRKRGSTFQMDINTMNPLGSKGMLALSFAELCTRLWSGDYSSVAPQKLKNMVSKINSQFTGYAQHDAQEFLGFLLDGLHEDLNRVKHKPYTTNIESNGRPDEVVAAESWDRYKLRNDSVVVDMFQGQFKSKLTCPKCNKVSITFDPYMYLSVPIPQRKVWNTAYFFPANPDSCKPVKYMVPLPKYSDALEFRTKVSEASSVPLKRLKVVQVNNSVFLRKNVCDGDLFGLRTSREKIYVFETPPVSSVPGGELVTLFVIQRSRSKSAGPVKQCSQCCSVATPDKPVKRCAKCLTTAYCSQDCQRLAWSSHKIHCTYQPTPIGKPFVVTLPKCQLTYSRLAQTMEAYARFSVHQFQPPKLERDPALPESGPKASNEKDLLSQPCTPESFVSSDDAPLTSPTPAPSQHADTLNSSLDQMVPDLPSSSPPGCPAGDFILSPVRSSELHVNTSRVPGNSPEPAPHAEYSRNSPALAEDSENASRVFLNSPGPLQGPVGESSPPEGVDQVGFTDSPVASGSGRKKDFIGVDCDDNDSVNSMDVCANSPGNRSFGSLSPVRCCSPSQFVDHESDNEDDDHDKTADITEDLGCDDDDDDFDSEKAHMGSTDVSRVDVTVDEVVGVREANTLSNLSSSSGSGCSPNAALPQPQIASSPAPPRQSYPFIIMPAILDGRCGREDPTKNRLRETPDDDLVDVDSLPCSLLYLDWKNEEPGGKSACIIVQDKPELEHTEDKSCDEAVNARNTNFRLEDCIDLFTEPETLSPQEAWHCPSCKEHVAATKEMSIWSLPDLLIVQLKRFSFGQSFWRDKIEEDISYPIKGLDLSLYEKRGQLGAEPAVYDLFGVVNHHGVLLGGHYTSYARGINPQDWAKDEHGWRLFNDSSVSDINEAAVVTRAAYLLFYRKRANATPGGRQLLTSRVGNAPSTSQQSKSRQKSRDERIAEQSHSGSSMFQTATQVLSGQAVSSSGSGCSGLGAFSLDSDDDDDDDEGDLSNIAVNDRILEQSNSSTFQTAAQQLTGSMSWSTGAGSLDGSVDGDELDGEQYKPMEEVD